MQSNDSQSEGDQIQISDIILTESLIENSIDILDGIDISGSTVELEAKFGAALVQNYPSEILQAFSKFFDIKNVFPWQVSCLTNDSVLKGSK